MPNENVDFSMHKMTTKQLLRVFECQDEWRVERIKKFLKMRFGRDLTDVHKDLEFLCKHVDSLTNKVKALEQRYGQLA